MFKLTWFIQYSNISMANVGLIVLGGQSLKVIACNHITHWHKSAFQEANICIEADLIMWEELVEIICTNQRIQYKPILSDQLSNYMSLQAIAQVTGMHLSAWIFIAGMMYLCFATAVTNLSALRHFSAFSLALSFTYIMVAVIISVKDGKLEHSPKLINMYSLPLPVSVHTD